MKVPLVDGWEASFTTIKPYNTFMEERVVIDKTFDKLHDEGNIPWSKNTTPFGSSVFVVWRTTYAGKMGFENPNVNILDKVTLRTTIVFVALVQAYIDNPIADITFTMNRSLPAASSDEELKRRKYDMSVANMRQAIAAFIVAIDTDTTFFNTVLQPNDVLAESTLKKETVSYGNPKSFPKPYDAVVDLITDQPSDDDLPDFRAAPVTVKEEPHSDNEDGGVMLDDVF